MDTVISRLKSCLRWLLATLKDISWALPSVNEVILYVLNGVDALPAIVWSLKPILLGMVHWHLEVLN